MTVTTTTTVKRAVLVTGVLAVLLLSACGGGAPGAGSSDGVEPGGAAAPGSPCAATGPEDDDTLGLVGLSEAEAIARAEEQGLSVRVVGRGEECFVVTMDYRQDRVNLDLSADGVVRGAGRG